MGHEDHASEQTDSVHGFLRDTQTYYKLSEQGF